MSNSLIALITGALILAGAFFLGRASRKSADNGRELELLRRHEAELTRELKKAREDLDRRREIFIKIPSLVRRLSEKLPPHAIPRIAVRFMKDFFRASRAGFFTPVGDGAEFTLTEGVGFPENWKDTVRLPADQGMLGMAVQKEFVVSREEFLALRGKETLGTSPLEQEVGIADLIAPVNGPSGIVGIIVIAGCAAGIRDEGSYASMLADLLGSAFRNAMFFQSANSDILEDPLTGLSNRRHFAQWFESEIRQAKNYHQPLSLLIFDIDHFKKINDTLGHQGGDLVLKKLAETIRGHTRTSDIVARYGGEEFVIVMTSSNREQALVHADSLRKIIEALEIRVQGHSLPVRCTISGGVAAYPGDGGTTTELIRAADDALYAAKQEGRNRILEARHLGIDGKPIR